MLWQPFGQVINSNPVERFVKLANSLTVISYPSKHLHAQSQQ